MEVSINPLHVLKGDLFPQDHLVECSYEKCIEEPAVEDGKPDNPSDELEVIQMFGVDTGMRIYLKGVIVVGGVLEEAVERVEHLVRKKEEKLSGETAIIQPILAIELDHQPFLEVAGSLAHDFGVGVLENMASPNLHMTLALKNP